MKLETPIEIDFECLVPSARLIEGYAGQFKFSEKIKYRRKKFEYPALIEFLNIPRLSVGISTDLEFTEKQKEKRLRDRTAAKHDFYKRWGFLTASNEYQSASESDATFDAFHIELWNYNTKRLRGELQNVDTIRFKIPELIEWTEHTYAETKMSVPIFKPKDLATALYTTWFFASKELSQMKTCRHFQDYGPRLGCGVFFMAKPSHKEFCSPECKKAAFDKRNPKAKRKGKL